MAASSTVSCKVLNSPYMKDITGLRSGMLVAIEPVGRKSGKVQWRCVCDCGNETISTSCRLTSNKHKSCGCLSRRKGSDNPKWNGVGLISGSYWSSVRNGAKIRNIDFDISKDFAWGIYENQDGKCSYSGLPIQFGGNRTASLDRKDSQLGYTKNNVHWIHADVNKMKWTLSENDFMRFVYLVCQPVSYELKESVRPNKNPKWSGFGNVPNWYVGRLKNIARRRNILFDENIDAELLWGLYLNQNHECNLTGIPIDFPVTSYTREWGTVSLDRIDSGKGYEPGNIQFVHKIVNQMKNIFSISHFKYMCEMIFNNSPLLAELSERQVALG